MSPLMGWLEAMVYLQFSPTSTGLCAGPGRGNLRLQALVVSFAVILLLSAGAASVGIINDIVNCSSASGGLRELGLITFKPLHLRHVNPGLLGRQVLASSIPLNPCAGFTWVGFGRSCPKQETQCRRHFGDYRPGVWCWLRKPHHILTPEAIMSGDVLSLRC